MKHTLTFDIKTTQRHYDENGYLHVDASNITKAQIVPYYGWEIPDYEALGITPERIYQMYRPAEELQKAAATFSGVPLAFEHHEMNAENMPKDKIIGTVGTEVNYIAPYVVAPLVITDAEAITHINNGDYKELSAAYMYEPEMTSGIHEGEHYDGIMRNIRGNHVALVKEGRAGHDVVVADSKPANIKTHKGVLSMKKKNVSAVLRRAFALDAVPEIEAAEVSAASLLSAINAIEAQREGLDPHTIGLDIDKDASVEDIIEKLFPEGNDDDKEAVKAVLVKLQGAGKAGDEGEPEGAEPETKPEAVDEEIAAAMDKCGLDAEDPDAVKAFAEGVKFGETKEKTEPEKLDKEHEAEGEKKAVEGDDGEKIEVEAKDAEGLKEEVKAMDSALRKEIARAKDEMRGHFKALVKAAQDCAPFAAIKDPMAFDSASDIYKRTLELNGVSTRGIDKSAYPAMVAMLRRGQGATIAADAKNNYGKLPEAFAGLERISNK